MAKMTLEELGTQLRAAWGETLHAVALYGSAAAPGADAKAKCDVLVIVDALDRGRLDAVSAVVRAWTDAGHPPPMTMTLEEWRGSADIFPMEYADILERHRVLQGALPADGVAPSRADLRRQLENQAMGKLLHLRQGVLAAGGDARRQRELLAVSKSAILALFRATLHLHGLPAPADPEAQVREAAQVVGFDPQPFVRVLRHVRGAETLATGAVGETLSGYLAGVEQLKRHLDIFPTDQASHTT